MTREDRRKRQLALKYKCFAKIQTGGAVARFMDAVKTCSSGFEVLPGMALLAGSTDAPEWMPAGSTCSDGQRECKRP